MTKTSDIIISAASVAAAINAISNMAMQNAELSLKVEESNYNRIASAIMSGNLVRTMIETNLPPISHSVRINDEILAERYATVAQTLKQYCAQYPLDIICTNGTTNSKANANDVDSTLQGQILGCYSNCHTACHGSRGWR